MMALAGRVWPREGSARMPRRGCPGILDDDLLAANSGGDVVAEPGAAVSRTERSDVSATRNGGDWCRSRARRRCVVDNVTHTDGSTGTATSSHEPRYRPS